MPASPAVVVLYITDLASRVKPGTITRRLAAISVAHQREGHPSPTTDPAVREVARGIRRTMGTAVDEAAPATIGDVRKMVACLPDTLAGTRDRVALLVGFAGALRRSELVGLDVEDLTRRDEGMTALVRRSKSDQEAAGRKIALPFGTDEHTCPARAIDAWLDATEIESGPLLRSIDRHGNVGEGRLSSQSITAIIRSAATGAGLDASRYSGHSLRAGFATTAAAAGASERQIAAQTGHKSMEVLRRYVRHGSIFSDNAVGRLGL